MEHGTQRPWRLAYRPWFCSPAQRQHSRWVNSHGWEWDLEWEIAPAPRPGPSPHSCPPPARINADTPSSVLTLPVGALGAEGGVGAAALLAEGAIRAGRVALQGHTCRRVVRRAACQFSCPAAQRASRRCCHHTNSATSHPRTHPDAGTLGRGGVQPVALEAPAAGGRLTCTMVVHA